MSDTKRMIGDYNVLQAISIGSKEIIIGECANANSNERFLCAYCERDELFERYDKCMVSDSYGEIIKLFGDRISESADLLIEEEKNLNIPYIVLTEADCIRADYSQNLNGKIIVINPDVLKPEYRRSDRQIYLVTGGFGASGNSRGRAVFCTNLYTGERTRYNREDILGIIKKETMPEWAKEKLKTIKQKEKKHNEKIER